MMLPGVAAPNLGPRMGTSVVSSRGGVQIFELRTRSLLNRCDSTRVPFEWTVNPYRGCAMGCRYCYATYTHEFMGHQAGFHNIVYAKTGGGEETGRRLESVVRRGERIALGTATDPYQPAERDLGVTRAFLERVASRRGVRLGITTKGALILRDLELLQRIALRSELVVHVSLISWRADLLRRLEPWAPPPEVRVEVLRRLVQAGLKARLSLAPILPLLTDSEEDLDALLSRVAAAGVSEMSWQLLFLRSPTREKYLSWLASEFPSYSAAYERAYGGRAYLGGSYPHRVRATVERLRRRHGLEAIAFIDEPRQLALFPPLASRGATR